jgi:hypothetical protein
MKIRTLVVMSAFITAVTAQGASAQTTATSKSRTQQGSTAASRAKAKPSSTYLRKKTTPSSVPPPPPLPTRVPRRAKSASKSTTPTMIGVDPTGRRDQVGHPVNHYAAVRGKQPTGAVQSAAVQRQTSSKPRENPQKTGP